MTLTWALVWNAWGVFAVASVLAGCHKESSAKENFKASPVAESTQKTDESPQSVVNGDSQKSPTQSTTAAVQPASPVTVSSSSDSVSAVAEIAPAFETIQAHNVADLLLNGCDVVSDSFSLSCRWASFRACQARGFAGGSGPVEIGPLYSQITCVSNASGMYREVGYEGGCNHLEHSSIFCDSRARRECVSHGSRTSIGVVAANGSVVGTLCLNAGSGAAEVSTTLAELLATNPGYPVCNGTSVVGNANGCQHHAHRVCVAKGYSGSFGVQEFDSATGNAAIVCVQAPMRNDVINGPQGLERALVLGDNVVGSFVPGPHETNTPDVVVNSTGRPLLVRRIDYGSNYDGSRGYSRDTCIYLNRGGIYQFDDNDDGEIVCTYSDVAKDPVQNFRETGILLRPGERLIFHATPRWGRDESGNPNGLHKFVWAKLLVSEVNPGLIPVRRIRFPKWDTGYSVNGSLMIAAGNESASPEPSSVPPDKPKRNSNWWYLSSDEVVIRGMSIFMSQGQPDGVQGAKACLRVVRQGGANLIEPRCFDIRDDRFGPHTFDTIFGSAQGGSAFIRFDQHVPAGALIGMDITFSTDSPTHLDFVGYVWLHANQEN